MVRAVPKYSFYRFVMFLVTGKHGRDGREEKGQDDRGTGHVLGKGSGQHVHAHADGAADA